MIGGTGYVEGLLIPRALLPTLDRLLTQALAAQGVGSPREVPAGPVREMLQQVSAHAALARRAQTTSEGSETGIGETAGPVIVRSTDVALQLGISSRRVTQLATEGRIHGQRDHNRWTFRQQDVDRFIADREDT